MTPASNRQPAETMTPRSPTSSIAARSARPLRIGTALLALLLCTVSLAADEPGRPTNPVRPNFAGSWEKDFARSDKWEDELQRTIDQLNRDMQRQSTDAGGYSMSGSRRRAGNIIANARLAELISRQTIMQITQTGGEARIERQGDAALICSTSNSLDDTFDSVHGTEYCGWDRQQLVFEIMLTEGVIIEHRFSLDPDGQTISMLTSVYDHNSTPFNLITFFNRYEAPPEGFNCVQTLSRGQVCSAADAQP